MRESFASLTRRINSFKDPFELRYFVGCNLEFIHKNFKKMNPIIQNHIEYLKKSWARHDEFFLKMLDGISEDVEALEISPGVKIPKSTSLIPKTKARSVSFYPKSKPEIKPKPIIRASEKPSRHQVIIDTTGFDEIKPSNYLSVHVKKFHTNLVEEARRELTRVALRSTSGDLKKAAKALGVTERTLEYWVRDFKEEDANGM